MGLPIIPVGTPQIFIDDLSFNKMEQTCYLATFELLVMCLEPTVCLLSKMNDTYSWVSVHKCLRSSVENPRVGELNGNTCALSTSFPNPGNGSDFHHVRTLWSNV